MVTGTVAQICLGGVKAGMESLREHRQRAIANNVLFCRTGTDGPFRIAIVLQGDFSGGIRFLEGAVELHHQAGNTTARDLTRMFLAETYFMMETFIPGSHEQPDYSLVSVKKHDVVVLQRSFLYDGPSFSLDDDCAARAQAFEELRSRF
jgi:hypothetical protein